MPRLRVILIVTLLLGAGSPASAQRLRLTAAAGPAWHNYKRLYLPFENIGAARLGASFSLAAQRQWTRHAGWSAGITATIGPELKQDVFCDPAACPKSPVARAPAMVVQLDWRGLIMPLARLEIAAGPALAYLSTPPLFSTSRWRIALGGDVRFYPSVSPARRVGLGASVTWLPHAAGALRWIVSPGLRVTF